jgi:hypothetical protein
VNDLRDDRYKSSPILSVTPGKTDTELAAEFRNKLRPLLEEALGVLNAASGSGLQVNFQFGRDVYGRHMVVSIDVVRPL